MSLSSCFQILHIESKRFLKLRDFRVEGLTGSIEVQQMAEKGTSRAKWAPTPDQSDRILPTENGEPLGVKLEGKTDSNLRKILTI